MMDANENFKAELKGLQEIYGVPSNIMRKFIVTKYKNNKDEMDLENELFNEIWEAGE